VKRGSKPTSFEHDVVETKTRDAAIMAPEDEDRVERWERATAYPLTVLSVLFIVVYAWPILDPAMEPHLRRTCEIADLIIWILFGIDYLARLGLARRKRSFLRTHWFDLTVLLLPFLRPLRALRLVNALRVINQRAMHLTRGRLALYIGAATVLIVLVAGLAVLDAERGRPGSTIEDYPQALWWGVATITTVGYGDLYPTTLEGRLIAVVLMVSGIGLIGFVTGSLASWIVERISDNDDRTEDATRQELVTLTEEIRRLRTEVQELKVGRSVPAEQERGET
jgi:voltage-gated potassium channel